MVTVNDAFMDAMRRIVSIESGDPRHMKFAIDSATHRPTLVGWENAAHRSYIIAPKDAPNHMGVYHDGSRHNFTVTNDFGITVADLMGGMHVTAWSNSPNSPPHADHRQHGDSLHGAGVRHDHNRDPAFVAANTPAGVRGKGNSGVSV